MYHADPGGVFASDTHRRVLGTLSKPGLKFELDELLRRASSDPYTEIGPDESGELSDVLKDLEADGHVSESREGWGMTKAGLEAIQANPSDSEE